MVTSAAYLLFYRRKTDKPLGGPFFEQIMSSTDPDQSHSRAPSPMAGEGKRLESSSRNGLSGASAGVGVGHQAGGGGPVGPTAMNESDEPPPYSTAPEPAEMDVDGEIDEAIDMDEGAGPYQGPMSYDQTNWSFDGLNTVDTQPPPNSDAGSLAVGSNGSENRMADFADDEGTTMTHFDTPPDRGDEQIPWEDTFVDVDDAPVAEVRISPPREEDEGAGAFSSEKLGL